MRVALIVARFMCEELGVDRAGLRSMLDDDRELAKQFEELTEVLYRKMRKRRVGATIALA